MNEIAKPDVLRGQLAHMIDGYRISQLMHAAAELRVADLLQDGPKRADQLAQAASVDPRSLLRFLLALASAGLLEYLGDERFALRALGEWLRSDAEGSLRPWALLTARMYRPWGNLSEVIRTGDAGLGSGHGKGRWERLGQSQEEARIFHAAMAANSAWLARAVLAACDFSDFRCIVDVGGGNGSLIASILRRYPAVRAIVFDLPEATAETGMRLDAAGIAQRCEVRAGSFFDTVPSGGDAYVLSRVLHDWDDDHALRILQSVRRAMPAGAMLLIMERLLDPEHPSIEATLADLSMLLMNGGCERSRPEFDDLIRAAGFRLARVVATQTPIHILECVAT